MSTTPIPSLTLNDGHTFPRLGFGGDQIPSEQTEAAVTIALEVGYRHIDTAAAETGSASGAVKLTLSCISARLVNRRQSGDRHIRRGAWLHGGVT
jgi:2,5-diketo-D-gluconate reductase A